MTTATNPRPYRSADHLRSTITTPTGAITVSPQEAGRIHFDIASANHLPANLPDGMHGSRVLDIGRGVHVRASGSAYREGTSWVVRCWPMHGSQYPSGRDLTTAQDARARTLIGQLITEWAKTHEGDIAQADDIARNNSARTLEEKIAKHEDALTILRDQLKACEEGDDYTMYPDLPTDSR